MKADQTAIKPTSKNYKQDWTLDDLGNCSALDQDDTGNGSWDLEQDRTHNGANEIGTITATTGRHWADPAHNAAARRMATNC